MKYIKCACWFYNIFYIEFIIEILQVEKEDVN